MVAAVSVPRAAAPRRSRRAPRNFALFFSPSPPFAIPAGIERTLMNSGTASLSLTVAGCEAPRSRSDFPRSFPFSAKIVANEPAADLARSFEAIMQSVVALARDAPIWRHCQLPGLLREN